jgi:hypothetical protein
LFDDKGEVGKTIRLDAIADAAGAAPEKAPNAAPTGAPKARDGERR